MAFNAGDVVQLKSGSPKMTVTTVAVRGGREVVICTWFEGKKQTHGTFATEALVSAEAGGGVVWGVT